MRTKRYRVSVHDPPQKEPANEGLRTPNTPDSTAGIDVPVMNTVPETVETISPGPATGFEQSILRRLPVELRLHIYNSVLAPDNTDRPQAQADIAYPKLPEFLVLESDLAKSISHSRSKRPALLRTFRQVYVEAVDLLYQHRTFVFRTGIVFTAFATRIRRHHLDRIRHVKLELRGQHYRDLHERYM